MRALGYVEGGNVLVDSRGAQGRAERLPALARELLDAKPAVIVTFGTAAATMASMPVCRVGCMTGANKGL